MTINRAAVFAAIAAAATSTGLWAQPIAPVTVEAHRHHHNDPHRRVVDATRFFTNRQGAALSLPAEEDSFTFVVFGDRTGGPNEGINVLAQAVSEVNLLEPDLVMTVGDLIQGYNTTPDWLQQMNQYKEVMNELLCPWFPVAGNHDVYWRGPGQPVFQHESNYELHFGPLWYAFEHKNSMFIVLYSDEGDRQSGQKGTGEPYQAMSDEQFEWLSGMLDRAADAEHVFMFLHHPRWIGGRYGDDWERVHRRLVSAGNVTAVFAGHIHRMRSDPRDGIEYITLATTGGSQQGIAAQAGYLHHFNTVTVRRGQVAMSTVPVGEVFDPRAVTGEVSEAAGRLAGLAPTFRSPLSVREDGRVDGSFRVEVSNPVGLPIEVSLTPASEDGRWAYHPDHAHMVIEPGERAEFEFDVRRAAGTADGSLRVLELVTGVDLLTPTTRVTIPAAAVTVPGTLIVKEPSLPAAETALDTVAEGGAAEVDFAAVSIEDGPMTVEAWVLPRAYAGRDGVIGSEGYGFWFDSGRPIFYVNVGGRWVDAQMPEGRTLEPGRWAHLAGVFDGSRARFYIDGQLVDDVAATGSLRLTGTPLTIGADTGRGGPRNTMDGLVDEVRVSRGVRYSGRGFTPARRLSPDDRTALLLHMDGAAGSYLFDSSGRGAHARLVGGARLRPAAEN